jgi:multidrug resistance efflux pump
MPVYELDMNDFHNEMNTILDNGKVPVDAHGLRQSIETTQAEIREAVTNGDGEKLVDLDNRMRILSARLFGSDVSETKSAIDKAELEKISIGKEIEILREIKKQKNLAAGRTEQLFFKRMEKVNQAELQIQFAESRLTNARVTARESKAKLQKLLDEKQREQASAYKKYEFSRY